MNRISGCALSQSVASLSSSVLWSLQKRRVSVGGAPAGAEGERERSSHRSGISESTTQESFCSGSCRNGMDYVGMWNSKNPYAPPPKPLSSEDIASMLETPAIAKEVIEKLSESKRRELLVAASFYEWFGEEIKDGSEAEEALNNINVAKRDGFKIDSPTSQDESLSSSTSLFSHARENEEHRYPWSHSSVITDSNNQANSSWEEFRKKRRLRKVRKEAYRIRKEMQEANPMPNLPMSKVEYHEWIRGTVQTIKDPNIVNSSAIPAKVLFKVAMQTGLPFMAFGTLDNSMLILAGDMFDHWIGADLNLSPMGAAAMGGIVSGVVGIQIHGLAERAVTKYGPAPPALKASQWRSKPVQGAIHWGGTFGLVFGLFCGMFPLLIISDSASVRRAIDDDGIEIELNQENRSKEDS